MRRPSAPRLLAVSGAALLALAFAAPGTQAASTAAVVPADPGCQADPACLALVDRVGEAAKRAMARAIVHATVAAKTVDDISGYCDLFPGACGPGPSGYPNNPGRTGANNNITDVPGIKVGSYTNPDHIGTTALLMPDGATVGVEVRGSAPGTRGTDAVRSEQSVQTVHAVVMTGGSAYGLSAADGVVRWLEERRLGTRLDGDGTVMPLVPTSVIFDLGRFGRAWNVHATPEFGYRAISAARTGKLEQGNVGAGAGAQAGGVKGGLGFASEDLGDGVIVGAAVDINAAGNAYDAGTGCAFHSARYQIGNEFAALRPPPDGCGSDAAPVAATAGRNTTIGVVATNLRLSRPLLTKLAEYGQDGLGLAIRPSHALFDGDTVWSVSTGRTAGRTAVTRQPTSSPAPQAVTRGSRVPVLPDTGGGALLAATGSVLLLAGAWLGRRRRTRAGDY